MSEKPQRLKHIHHALVSETKTIAVWVFTYENGSRYTTHDAQEAEQIMRDDFDLKHNGS